MAKKSGVSVQWNGLDKSLLKMAVQIRETGPLLDSIGSMLAGNTQKRFDDEESPDGKKWKKSQRAMRENGKTLSNSGDLKKNISYKTEPNTVIVGTNKEYARIHQFGGTITPKKGKYLKFKTPDGYVSVKKVTIPPRPFIGISKDDRDEAKQLVGEFIKDCFHL